jgi:hypothetical protein
VIDLSNAKAPGWSKVVSELAADISDDRAYLTRLIAVVGQVSAAKQASVFIPQQLPGTQELSARAMAVWPPGADPQVLPPIEHTKDAQQAAVAAIESNQSRLFQLDEQSSALYDASPSKGSLIALPLPGPAGSPIAAMVLLTESRSKQALQSTLAMAEVLAGYIHLHATRQDLRRTQRAGMSLDLATRLIGAINQTESFKGSALRIVNDLVRTLGADRAAIGWVHDRWVEVVAISDAEHFDKRTIMVRSLADAMDECADQQQAVMYPQPSAANDAMLASAITAAHKQLAGSDRNLHVVSVPMRSKDTLVGVLTVELKAKGGQASHPQPQAQQGQPGQLHVAGQSDQAAGPAGSSGSSGANSQSNPLDLRGVEVLQAAIDLITPVLAIKRSDDRILPLRTLDSAKRTGAWLVGPRHTWWKVAGIATIAAMLFVTFFTINFRVGAPATIEPRTKRTLSIPFDGVIRALGPNVRPGAVVKAGDLLVEMDTSDLRLQLEGAQARLTQATRQMSTAMKESKVSESQLSQAAADRASADIALLTLRINMSKIVAPIDGTILTGELSDKVGASARTGEPLLQLAPMDDYLVIAQVDERDIAMIQVHDAKVHANGTTRAADTTTGMGILRTRGMPNQDHPLIIETIVPLAEAKEGKNRYEVRARLVTPEPWMRPGMEGIARLDIGERSLLWIGTRRVINELRLWFW